MQRKRFIVGLTIVCLMLLTAIPSAAQDNEDNQVLLPLVSNTAQSAPEGESELVAAAASSVLQPTVVDLLGKSGWPVALNDRGQVAGYSWVGQALHPFLWENGVIQDLGSLGGKYSYAEGINEHGQVVGRSETAAGHAHAFLWENGVMRDLGTLGGLTSYTTDINERGQVIGSSETAAGVEHAFLWENGVMRNLGTLGGPSSRAVAINERGQVVGSSAVDADSSHPFLWENGVMHDLDTLDATYGEATAINEHGQIVGFSERIEGDQRTDFLAFLWENGVTRDLGDDFYAVAINEHNQILDSSGFLWDNGVIYDFSYGSEMVAEGLNDRGQYFGWTGDPDWNSPFWGENGKAYGVASFIQPVGKEDDGAATAINQFGQVTGYVHGIWSTGGWRAFLYSDLVLLVSASTNGTVGGVAFADEDILAQNRATGQWRNFTFSTG